MDFWLFQELLGRRVARGCSVPGRTIALRTPECVLLRLNSCGQLPNMRRRRVETLRSE